MAHSHAAKLGEWVEAKDTGVAGRGRGLFATKDTPAGQVVLVDSPIVAVQLGSTEDEFGVGSAASERSIRACTRCLAQIGACVRGSVQRAARLHTHTHTLMRMHTLSTWVAILRDNHTVHVLPR